ncbi:MAG TPA: LysR family transcriptional regulator [Dongiaceae bacterium]|nr:LysR family transcriptional regulator [Dongiaceae bacterium]
MDRLGTMEAFAAVVESGSFSAAAQRLRSSKSLVSRQIAALEAELGARLFHRTTRSLTLTEDGRGYHAQVVRILEEIAEANASVSNLQAAPRGRLRINAPMSFGYLHLAPAVPDFLALYPEVEIDLTMSDRYVDLIEEGVDLAVRLGRLGDSTLIARKLATIRRVVCGSPDYFKTHGVPQTPEDLSQHACLCYSNLAVADEWRFLRADGSAWPVEVHGRLRADNGDALREAALKGLGLVYLPSFIIGRDLQAATLVSVLTDYVPQDAGLYAVYPHARHLSPKVRAFIDFLATRFGGQPYWDLVQ